MNYKIITDEQAFREFIEWLPKLQSNERFYVCLAARSKYCKDIVHISSDKGQVRRLLCTKDAIFDKVKQMECEVGSYKHRGVVIPQEALALYIHPNPRDTEKAAQKLLVKLADLTTKKYSGWNLQEESLTALHKSIGRKIFYDIDFDNTKFEDINIDGIINKDCITYIKTRGGFHLLVELEKVAPQYKNTWYRKLTTLKGTDINYDNMIPIPGSYQGGTTPVIKIFTTAGEMVSLA